MADTRSAERPCQHWPREDRCCLFSTSWHCPTVAREAGVGSITTARRRLLRSWQPPPVGYFIVARREEDYLGFDITCLLCTGGPDIEWTATAPTRDVAITLWREHTATAHRRPQ